MVTEEQIIEALKTDENLAKSVLPKITELEVGKTFIENRANALYKQNIDDEIKRVHTKYDEDMFEILGERPTTKEDGTKEKTYDKIKNLYSDLKKLREQKDSLSKDAKVKELTDEIERLKTEGGGKHVQEVFDKAKQDWQQKEAEYQKQLNERGLEVETTKKSNEISKALSGLKFNPDISESIKQMVIKNAEQELLKNSKLENGKLVYVDENGKPALNEQYEPKSTEQYLSSMPAVQDILLKEERKGGGADTTIKGSIKTISVEGKDTKALVLPKGSFATRSEFIDVAEKALIDSGITKRDKEWDTLKTQAYKEYNVSELPAQ